MGLRVASKLAGLARLVVRGYKRASECMHTSDKVAGRPASSTLAAGPWRRTKVWPLGRGPANRRRCGKCAARRGAGRAGWLTAQGLRAARSLTELRPREQSSVPSVRRNGALTLNPACSSVVIVGALVYVVAYERLCRACYITAPPTAPGKRPRSRLAVEATTAESGPRPPETTKICHWLARAAQCGPHGAAVGSRARAQHPSV